MLIEWIAGVQLLLYAIAWTVAARMVKEERVALGHWAAYAWLQGAGVFVTAPALATGQMPPVAGLLASLLGFAVAVRGVDVFLGHGRARHDRWGAAVVLATVLALVVAAVGVDDPVARRRWVGLPYGLGGATLLLSYALLCWPRLRECYGRVTVAVLVAPMALTGLFGVVSVLARGHLDGQDIARLQQASREPNIVVSLVMSGLFNFAYIFLLVGRLVGRLRDSARTDHLTGALNRRAIDAALHQAWHRQRRHGGGLAIALLDIDHFKRINDSWGHAAGDRALAWVAKVLGEGTRAYDTVGRWGGEEFVLVMTDIGPEDVLRRCERLRRALATGSADGCGVPITVSIGLAVCQPTDASVAALLERADRAMYAAKAAGRDRVVLSAATAEARLDMAAPPAGDGAREGA